ncbi:D-alpha,beta-D-heptose 1,7-bisphosphate phosphatase [Pontibacter ummariensis]|uniref:D,D-heptose 1,7-bisphosphate phosphatase n=1 Tax=Pontibacter ummariensis TaxID=1610492 RepID=A0A239F2E1_9BACT|nr:HAD family hydrolase [Pontibacter ummariensis]PRY12655.1 D-alpha,beta-D-heptose 1,7-bisphosphate phosphatase [Pontibacter ummariensis]SNS50332.1 D-alpha,beta-D-heptose 1,7-bisphosphate phosphatase [Pontibacter ummariensis]
MQKQKCVFLDRDGVLNRERGDYTFRLEDFEVLPKVPEALALLKQKGFLLIVITNQAGVAKGLYQRTDVLACHQKLQDACGSLIDAIYYAPGHPSSSESLSRKPDSLMLERAIARYNIDPGASWMVGDSMRDLEAAAKVGVKGILVGEKYGAGAHSVQVKDLREATEKIIQETKKPA